MGRKEDLLSTIAAAQKVSRWYLTGTDGDVFTSDGLAEWLMDRGRRLVAWHALGTVTVEEGVPFVRTSRWHSGALEMGVDRIKVTPLDTKGRPAGTAFVVGGVHKGYGL
jgi:hypothetical protein